MTYHTSRKMKRRNRECGLYLWELPNSPWGTLEALVEAGHDVCLAVTQPDKPKGRGKEMQPTPVKAAALKHGIPVYQPKKIRDPQCVEELAKYHADVCVVIAFGQILPKSILELTPYGALMYMLPCFQNTGERRPYSGQS